MPDLWKALGDVYGDRDADAPPVPREAPASERFGDPSPRYGSQLPLDDDLAAALSAALVNAPTPAPGAPPVAPPAPVPPYTPPVMAPPAAALPVAPQPPAAPHSPPAPSAPAPVAPVAPPAPPAAPAALAYAQATAPAAPATPAVATDRVSSWIAEIEDRNRRRDEGPDLTAVAQAPVWNRSDDDILPAAPRRRGRRK